jgi:peptide/nickel transport system substrate-binding protein
MTSPSATDVIIRDPARSRGPAPQRPGAQRGGTLRILRDGEYDSLDPQRIVTLQAFALGHLLFRTLTMFREDGAGSMVLLGDLAETPGRDVHGDGRVWEFVLKPGVRFEDGREITSADVAYGIARSFDPELADGPGYLRAWLGENDGSGGYRGPRLDPELEVPGIELPDDRTLILRFRDPHPDLPFAVSQPVTAPFPRGAEPGPGYAENPVASGPYRIAEHVPGKRLTLARNPHWDPETDAIRRADPDQIEIELGVQGADQNLRTLADADEDAFAVAENNAPEAVAAELLADPALAGRLRREPTPLIWYVVINTTRVTDLTVRRAIAHAVNRTAIRDSMVGPDGGLVVRTLLPEATIGHLDYPDPYPGGEHGDPDSARALLAGAAPELRILSRDGEYFTAGIRTLAASLESAGFRTQVETIDRPSHNSAVRAQGHPYDVYLMCIGADWPGGASLLSLFDGRTIAASGNDNLAYLDDPGVNAEIDRLGRLTADEAASGWGELDERLLRDHVPMVPVFSYRHVALSGSRVGGVFTSAYLGTPVYYDAYVVPTDVSAAKAGS